ncbi:SH3 domain-containing protein [Acinetobacter soli]
MTEKAPVAPSTPVETEQDYTIAYEAVVTAMPSLNVRTAPDAGSTQIGTVLHNQIIGVIKKINDSWVQIEFELNGKLVPAYVHSSYIKPYTGPTVPETVPGTKNVVLNYSDYDLKLTDMVQIQKKVNAQTDKYWFDIRTMHICRYQFPIQFKFDLNPRIVDFLDYSDDLIVKYRT